MSKGNRNPGGSTEGMAERRDTPALRALDGGKPPRASVPDGELARRSLRGNREAFGTLVDRHLDAAMTVATRLTGTREDAEDLVQDSFIRALERLDRFDLRRPFRPWFLRVLTNLGLNRQRREGLRAAGPLPPDLEGDAPLPDRVAEQAETESRVREALAALPEKQRLVVTLFELEGLTSREIGEVLGLSDATARWHLMEARKTLRAALPRDDLKAEESHHA